ncbi:MAG TPA: YebC/PmpR family DNA-binding transcriptional regulator [Bacilli bacterium]|nr:YebC/PmpR family DNA-binding transcriptional regulator [Bacilli bacterium]HPZ23346.1 YebC/PmpR family DNA-binding transcriptional regulator [Bacilli bacterium]
MGRAYEVRKASIQKNGAIKAKLYSTSSKEIYLVAKGNPDPESNVRLRRTLEKYKAMQVPNEIINRALDKAKGNDDTNYQELTYEGFGPGASTFIITTLTDKVNRTVSYLREVFNKIGKSLGVTNSVSYNYDHLTMIGFVSDLGDDIMMELLDKGIEIKNLETIDGEVVISASPSDDSKIRDVIENMIPNVKYTIDEIGWYPKEKVKLTGEDLNQFKIALRLLEEIDDVTEVYHNVDLDEEE